MINLGYITEKYDPRGKVVSNIQMIDNIGNVQIINFQENANAAFGVWLRSHNKSIEVVYPMFDDFKIFFKKYIVLYNYTNSIIAVIGVDGEKIAEGDWALSFGKNSITLTKMGVDHNIVLKSDGTRDSFKFDSKALATRLSQDIDCGHISLNLKHPDWLITDKRVYFDSIPDEYQTEAYSEIVPDRGTIEEELNTILKSADIKNKIETES